MMINAVYKKLDGTTVEWALVSESSGARPTLNYTKNGHELLAVLSDPWAVRDFCRSRARNTPGTKSVLGATRKGARLRVILEGESSRQIISLR